MCEGGYDMDFTKQYYDIPAQIDKNLQLVAEENVKKKQREIQLVESSKETVLIISEFKELVKKFIKASEEQTKSTNKLNKRLFWFTLISAMATVISAVIAIIQFVNKSF